MKTMKELQAAIRKLLGLGTPPAEPQDKAAADQTVKAFAAIKADLETALGHPVVMIDLGTVKVKLTTPCNCKNCQRRRKAPWN